MQVEKSKVGAYFFFIGLILLVIFFATDQAKHPAYGYFFAGFGAVFLGGYMMWTGRKPPPPSERFRSYRKWQEEQKEKKAEKKKKQQQ